MLRVMDIAIAISFSVTGTIRRVPLGFRFACAQSASTSIQYGAEKVKKSTNWQSLKADRRETFVFKISCLLL
jgi:hypothetical protein